MLTTKEIKQAVEEFKPDGFYFPVDHKQILCWEDRFVVDTSSNIVQSNGLYDLYIDRVIQAINRDSSFDIIQQYKGIDVWEKKDYESPMLELDDNATTEGIREAREKAIRFVLEEIGK